MPENRHGLIVDAELMTATGRGSGSTRRSSSSSIRGSPSTKGLRSAPALRCFSSPRPLWMLGRLIPVACATAVTPPCPSERASTARQQSVVASRRDTRTESSTSVSKAVTLRPTDAKSVGEERGAFCWFMIRFFLALLGNSAARTCLSHGGLCGCPLMIALPD